MKPDLKSIAIEIVLLAGLLVFARGFLPPTRTRLGFADEQVGASPQFDRMVFMVVDALRSDFVFSEDSQMHGVHDLLRNGKGYAFTAFSDPPTVTLPRLKGLTTGSSPNFLDAVINIAESDSASTLANQDSWVHQIWAQNKSIHMMGDNTWLKLFPGKFSKEDGTESFYVADFTEVDYNVTRNLDVELDPKNRNTWDVLILHYLGLDHIGHKGGPKSKHMPDKQKEMDGIATRIFDSLDDNTLFVLLGDHGMNDVGNHGGASAGETSAALVFLSKKFNNKVDAPLKNNQGYSYYSRILQVDIVPTISALLGLPTPRNSLGVVIEDLLDTWSSPKDRHNILNFNCDQLGVSDTCNFEQLHHTQRHLMRSSSEHILSYMYAGIAIITVSVLFSIVKSFKLFTSEGGIRLPGHYLWVWWIVFPSLLFVSMMGSSTVEEEHYVWYWALSGLLCHTFFAYQSKKHVAIIFIAYRVIRGWNSAGQKWTSDNDVGKFLAAHPLLNISLVGETLALLALVASINSIDVSAIADSVANTFSNSSQSSVDATTVTKDPKGSKSSLQNQAQSRKSNQSKNGRSQHHSKNNTVAKALSIVSALMVFFFKFGATVYPLNLPGMIWLSRLGFIMPILAYFAGAGDVGAVLFFIMQTKLQNIPLWLFIYAGRRALMRLYLDTGDPATCGLIGISFEFTCFFAFGGSNSLATIDLSNAYNGVSDYNIPLVALLTYLGNWAPSLYWSMVNLPAKVRILRSLIYSTFCLGVTFACLILRGHLFIWTVFSPKLLYVASWLVFHELLMTPAISLVTPKISSPKKEIQQKAHPIEQSPEPEPSSDSDNTK